MRLTQANWLTSPTRNELGRWRSRVNPEWRADEWTPAVRAAGLEHRSPYALRHTYATFGIAAGVSLFELARFMGMSVEQIDKTYGHLLADSLERTRHALDVFTSAPAQEKMQER